MPIRLAIPFTLLFLLTAPLAWADEVGDDEYGDDDGICMSDQECAPYEICTVSIGDCGPGPGKADVCTGTCEMGRRLRVVPYAGGGLHRATQGVTLGTGMGQLGLELIPPVLAGHLSISAEYFAGTLRTGVASPWPLFDGFLLSPRLDVLPLRRGGMGLTAGLRLDYFPWMPFKFLTPAHYFSIALEGGGALLERTRYPYGTLSLRIWL